MESHEAGFPPFPHSLEIPSGFPHYHGLGGWLYVFSCLLNSNDSHRKGLVTDVSGPKCNERSGTLTPERGLSSLFVRARARGLWAGVAGRNEPVTKLTFAILRGWIADEKPTNEMVRRCKPPLGRRM